LAIRQSLRELGYVEGRNVVFEARDSQGEAERLERSHRNSRSAKST